MAKIKVISTGNTIVASEEFAEAQYPGDWELAPAPPAPTHKTSFSPKELLDAFTTAETFAAVESNHPLIQWQLKVLSLKRSVTINASDEGYQSAIALLHSEGVLTEERRDELLNGIPIK